MTTPDELNVDLPEAPLECISCRKPKAKTECPLCFEPICKNCLQPVDSDAFQYMPDRPEDLSHARYCGFCLDATINPALEVYTEILERAKKICLLTKAYKGHVSTLKKAKYSIEVKDCPDREELIMKLAFMAAKEGYNALLQTDLVSQKIRNEAYQKSSWSGEAWPATIDAERLDRDEAREEMYRRGK